VVLHIYTTAIFTVMYVGAELEIPGDDYLQIVTDFVHSYAAVTVLFYTALWTIKVSFLIFFYRIRQNTTQHKVLWWVAFITTLVTYFASLGTREWGCLVAPLLTIMTECLLPSSIAYSVLSLKVACFLDVFSDFLSKMDLLPTSCPR
jgi:hypothetical protein